MTKTVFLHIGTHKTGTTSIQQALIDAVRNGAPICYPLAGLEGSLGHRNQNALAQLYMSDQRLSVHLPDEYQEACRKYRGRLLVELRSAGDAVISAESLSFYFAPGHAERLRLDLMSCGFRDFHVLLYVRDPAEYFLSMRSQFLKNSVGLTAVSLHPSSFRYRFLEMVDTWENAFPGKVVVRHYRSDAQFDVVQDFAKVLYEKMGVSLPLTSARENTSLSAEGMQILEDYQRSFWPASEGLTPPDMVTLSSFLAGSTLPGQTRPVLKESVAHIIRANHEADADVLYSRYGVDLDLRDGDSGKVVDVDCSFLVADILESIDTKVVNQLLLLYAHQNLQPADGKRSHGHSLRKRIAARISRTVDAH